MVKLISRPIASHHTVLTCFNHWISACYLHFRRHMERLWIESVGSHFIRFGKGNLFHCWLRIEKQYIYSQILHQDGGAQV